MQEANIDRRQLIIDVAADLFAQKGYDGVGVQEIADKSNVTKPTLYYYFTNKIGIFEAIMHCYIDPLVNDLAVILKNESNFEDSLFSYFKMYVKHTFDSPELATMLLSMQYAPNQSAYKDAFLNHGGAIFDVLRDIFVKYKYLLGNMNGREDQFAFSFLGVINYYVLSKIKFAEKIEYDENDIRMYLHQYLHGIYS